MTQYEREEYQLEDDYFRGIITNKEYNELLLEMQRSYRADMDEACHDAYDRERENW